jgi:hypothetical protein
MARIIPPNWNANILFLTNKTTKAKERKTTNMKAK